MLLWWWINKSSENSETFGLKFTSEDPFTCGWDKNGENVFRNKFILQHNKTEQGDDPFLLFHRKLISIWTSKPHSHAVTNWLIETNKCSSYRAYISITSNRHQSEINEQMCPISFINKVSPFCMILENIYCTNKCYCIKNTLNVCPQWLHWIINEYNICFCSRLYKSLLLF